MAARQGRGRARNQAPNVQLFEDTTGQQAAYPPQPGFNNAVPSQPGPYGGNPQGFLVPGQQMLNDPMANMAMSYGQNLADQGKDYVEQNIKSYVSTSKLKYYFAVDTSYVGKKLGLLFFPFLHSDWSIRYNQDEPVAPRYELNAPDLYIPVMAFVTYVLLVGVVLGMQDRFSPEMLGLTASTALVWLVIEIVLLLLSMYLMRVSTDLKYLDLLAYCGYKYVGMIVAIAGNIFFAGIGYWLTLLWMSITISFFLIRSLKLAIIPHTDAGFSQSSKRHLYMLLVIAFSQPVFMWWLTSHFLKID